MMSHRNEETPSGGNRGGATVEKALSETLFINDSTTTPKKIQPQELSTIRKIKLFIKEVIAFYFILLPGMAIDACNRLVKGVRR